jgi:glycosyltransferase involved in cell wall biosynthesis
MTVTDNNLQEMSSKLIELINNENLFSLSEMARIKSNQYTLNRIGEQWSNLLKDKI